MKMDKVAGSGNDEFYTPIYAIEPLLKYIIIIKNRTIPPIIAKNSPKFVKIKYKIPINIAILINEAKKFIYKNTF